MSEIEKRKNNRKKKINETKTWFFEKVSSINKSSARLKAAAANNEPAAPQVNSGHPEGTATARAQELGHPGDRAPERGKPPRLTRERAEKRASPLSAGEMRFTLKNVAETELQA